MRIHIKLDLIIMHVGTYIRYFLKDSFEWNCKLMRKDKQPRERRREREMAWKAWVSGSHLSFGLLHIDVFVCQGTIKSSWHNHDDGSVLHRTPTKSVVGRYLCLKVDSTSSYTNTAMAAHIQGNGLGSSLYIYIMYCMNPINGNNTKWMWENSITQIDQTPNQW